MIKFVERRRRDLTSEMWRLESASFSFLYYVRIVRRPKLNSQHVRRILLLPRTNLCRPKESKIINVK